jgi:hypothetical protein
LSNSQNQLSFQINDLHQEQLNHHKIIMQRFSDISQLIEQISHISQNDLTLSIANLSGEYENANKLILNRLKKCNSTISNIPGAVQNIMQSLVQNANEIFIEGLER